MDLLIHPDAKKSLDAFMQKPSHAVLLTGADAIGKKLLARFVAEKVLLTQNLHTFPYYRELAPLDGKKSISAEQIREIIHFLTLKVPGKAAVRRIVLIPDAEIMTTEAQNILLKSLEEPPTDTVIILTSSQPLKLLSTIRSRTMAIPIATPDATMSTRALTTIFGTDKDVRQALLQAEGRIGAAHALLSGIATDLTLGDIKRILTADTFNRLLIVEKELKDKVVAERFVDLLITAADAGLSHSLASGKSKGRWFDVLAAAMTAKKSMQKNANSKLVLTELMLAIK